MLRIMTRERLLRSAKNNQVRAFKGDNTCGAARDLSRLEGEEASEEPPPPGPEHFGLRFGMKTKLLLPRYLWRRRTCLVERPQRIHPLQERLNTLVSASASRLNYCCPVTCGGEGLVSPRRRRGPRGTALSRA